MQGRLLFGVPFNGTTYFDFKVRLLTLGGECAVVDMLAELGLDAETEHAADKMLVELAYLTQQVEIVGIPQAQLTPAFLLDNLTPSDYEIITHLIGELRKKHIAAGGSPSNPDKPPR